MIGSLVATLSVGVACSSDDDGDVASDDTPVAEDTGDVRQTYRSEEIDGVHAVVADCFVVEDAEGAARYSTTVEVHNQSDDTHSVAVTIEADDGRGGISDAIDIPAGSRDAWAVVGTDATTTPVGDVECDDYVDAIGVIVDE